MQRFHTALDLLSDHQDIVIPLGAIAIYLLLWGVKL